MATSENDTIGTVRIERSIVIAATPERVWQIVSEPGWWINGGTIRPHRIEDAGDATSIVHDEEHGAFRIRTERLDPPRYAAFRWLGRADEKGAGTLTEFWVEDAGTDRRRDAPGRRERAGERAGERARGLPA